MIEPKIENLVGLMFTEYVAAIDQSCFVTNANTDLLDRGSRKLVCKEFDSRFFAVGGRTDNLDEIVQIRVRSGSKAW